MEALRAGAPGALSLVAFPDGAFERGRKVARVLGGRLSGRERIWVHAWTSTRVRRRRGTGICGWGMRRFGSSDWMRRDFHRAGLFRIGPHRPLARGIFFNGDIGKLVEECGVRKVFELVTEQSFDSR